MAEGMTQAERQAEEQSDCASLIENGWFMEKNAMWPGTANSYEVKEVLLHRRTDYQDLMVFESTSWGKILVLDGVVQLTERDEMSYQEMMTHVPLFAHPAPRSVLIIGGGDGGILREVVKHESVCEVTHCEIDSQVVDASKRFFPSLACAFGNPKTKLVIGDAFAFAQEAPDSTYDVIIVDSSDEVGPAAELFSQSFFVNMHRILRPGGIVCSNGEGVWENVDLIVNPMRERGEVFASVEYGSIQVPTYPSGQIGCFLARKAFADPRTLASCRSPRRPVPVCMELRYYTEDMHKSAFVLPAFVEQRIRALEPPTKKARGGA